MRGWELAGPHLCPLGAWLLLSEPYVLIKAPSITWQPRLAGLGAESLTCGQEASARSELSIGDEQAWARTKLGWLCVAGFVSCVMHGSSHPARAGTSANWQMQNQDLGGSWTSPGTPVHSLHTGKRRIPPGLAGLLQWALHLDFPEHVIGLTSRIPAPFCSRSAVTGHAAEGGAGGSAPRAGSPANPTGHVWPASHDNRPALTGRHRMCRRRPSGQAARRPGRNVPAGQVEPVVLQGFAKVGVTVSD